MYFQSMKTIAPPPMIDSRVWELTKKKVKKNRNINLLVGLAALEPGEAIELLSMNARDRSAYGGLPYLTCRQAILVRQDAQPSDPIVDLRFRRMMADIVMASDEERDAWIGYPSVSDLLSRACPMWFCAAMSERFLSLMRYRQERTPEFSPGKLENEATKMTEDALRLLRRSDFKPKESSYKTPYPWSATVDYRTYPFVTFEAAELLWSSLDARIDEKVSLERMLKSRQYFSNRWVNPESPLFTSSLPPPRSAPFSLGLLRRMISSKIVYMTQGRIGDIEELLAEPPPEDSLQWLADGIVSADVLSDEGLQRIQT